MFLCVQHVYRGGVGATEGKRDAEVRAARTTELSLSGR